MSNVLLVLKAIGKWFAEGLQGDLLLLRTFSKWLTRVSRPVVRVLRFIGQWLAGSALLVTMSWFFLRIVEDGAELTPRIQHIEVVWMWVSFCLAIPLGYPLFLLASAILYRLTHPLELELLGALGAMAEALAKSNQRDLRRRLEDEEPQTPAAQNAHRN